MYYVLDDKGNKIEAYSKEEIMAVLQQAIADGSLSGVDAQSAFVSKLKCCVGGGTYKQAFITEAKYNELKENKQLEADTFYTILDDNTLEIIKTNIEGLWEAIDDIGGDDGVIAKILNGKVGDVIIPQKKLVFENTAGATTFTLNEYINKTFEIHFLDQDQVFKLKCVGNEEKAFIGKYIIYDFVLGGASSTAYWGKFYIFSLMHLTSYGTGVFNVNANYYDDEYQSLNDVSDLKVTKIYEIIE